MFSILYTPTSGPLAGVTCCDRDWKRPWLAREYTQQDAVEALRQYPKEFAASIATKRIRSVSSGKDFSMAYLHGDGGTRQPKRTNATHVTVEQANLPRQRRDTLSMHSGLPPGCRGQAVAAALPHCEQWMRMTLAPGPVTA